jgi:hypothetical protein
MGTPVVIIAVTGLKAVRHPHGWRLGLQYKFVRQHQIGLVLFFAHCCGSFVVSRILLYLTHGGATTLSMGMPFMPPGTVTMRPSTRTTMEQHGAEQCRSLVQAVCGLSLSLSLSRSLSLSLSLSRFASIQQSCLHITVPLDVTRRGIDQSACKSISHCNLLPCISFCVTLTLASHCRRDHGC